ncbi:MAG: PKD domain-containing protein, partial [Ignavibacteriales bacterium]
ALWRNDQLSSIPDGVNGTSVGWTNLTNLAAPQGYFITAVTVSRNPAHVLYYSATNFQTAPKIYKLTNSATATSGVTEIPIPAAPNGAYVHGIAINPDDANEILVVMSNYNIVGLYHSTNGGQLYTAIEGNLEGTQQNPGPSLRSASILPGSNKTYFVATSTGLYSTTQINGNNTTWVLEGANQMGNVIVDHVVSRKTDGRVVAGTHGRGAFVGSAGGGGAAILNVNVSSLHYEVLPNGTRTKEIIISNPGGANLDFNIAATFNGDNPNKGITQIVASNLSVTDNLNGITLKKVPALKNSTEVILEPDAGEQELILDDGDAFPDGFFGVGLNGYNFFWANRFQLTQDFDLEKIRWYMKTESAGNNQVEIEVQNASGNAIFNTTQSMSLSSSGKWYEYELPQSISFQNGNSFYLIIISRTSSITFPAAYDDDGQVTGNSYWAYYEVSSGYFSGWVVAAGNTAWLVRAVGNSGGGENQPPVAVAQVSPNPANVNETVNFNGQSSSDPDGTIVQYTWVFGDGNTSNQMNATHAYSQAGTYNYSLTVTDNLGATGQTNGQITINGGPSRWTIIPSSGNVSSGGQQSVLITFDAQNLPEGNYTGQINVTSNGGNMNIPVTIWVSNSADAEDDLGKVISYSLEQNFPNPFNPSTTIRWSIADAGNVQLKIFNLNGEEITTLVNEYRNAGSYETIFDAALLNRKALASGIYFYTLRTDNFSESKKFVLLK